MATQHDNSVEHLSSQMAAKVEVTPMDDGSDEDDLLEFSDLEREERERRRQEGFEQVRAAHLHWMLRLAKAERGALLIG